MGIPYAEVIGDPIAHSKSPLIHKFWLRKLGLEGDYRATRVTVDDLPAYLASRRTDADWRGCNVTMPLKQDAAGHVDEVDPRSARVGALNVIYPSLGRTTGTNTDVLGILDVLPTAYFRSDALPEIRIIGAGGAARALLAACKERLVSLVFFNVRNPEKAWPLLREWEFGGTVGPLDDAHNLQTPHIVANATPLGMRGQPQMPSAVLRHIEEGNWDQLVVFDMVYDPVETELLATARRRGLRTVDGLALLIAQADHAFRIFFGSVPPREYDAELRELLTQ
ncbi:shikimate dehydrogenase family protein [Sphingosinicella sp.]|uniref:shikimate dehydrogenase family protein n=1 Tax=Sphingosinicella sp. TaxID=1917971 RepID=UPI00403806C8